MKNPKVSVLMTVYNTDKYLKSSINSILNQSFKKWELIVADDCSTDKSKEILLKIKNKKVRKFFLKKHVGRIKAFNFALKKTKGKYIAILDSDDFSHKKRLYFQEKILNENNQINLVATRTCVIDKEDKKIKLQPTLKEIKNFNHIITYKNVIPFSSIMFRRNYLKSIGGIPKYLKYAIDYGIILKFLKENRKGFFVIPKILTTCRALRNSLTYDEKYKLIRIKDTINLLFFSLENLKLDIYEKYNIYLRITINYISYFLIKTFKISK